MGLLVAVVGVPLDIAGEGRVVDPVPESVLTGMLTPGLICNVVSSRSAVRLPGGRVPNQPSDGSLGRLRCSLRRSSEEGIKEEESFDERGRKDARRANESVMPCARTSHKSSQARRYVRRSLTEIPLFRANLYSARTSVLPT